MRTICYGISMKRLCQVIVEGANGGEWCQATVVLGYLRGEIPPEYATRRYLHQGHDHGKQDIARRKKHPADVRVDRGRKYVVFRCLSDAKTCGLLESQGPPGGRREYRLTEKGRELLRRADGKTTTSR